MNFSMRNFHIYLGLFFLPIFLLYAFTGSMFLSGQRSRGVLEETKVPMAWSTLKEEQLLLARQFLKDNNITEEPPNKITSTPTSLLWGYSGAFSIFLIHEPGEELVTVQIHRPTLYSRLMAWHANRADGGFLQIFTLIFALAWPLSYLGSILKPRFLWRGQDGLFLAAGLVVTTIICWASVP